VGSGRSRRYREDAIGILKEIRDLREDMHMPWDAITDALAKKYPIDATPAGPSAAAQAASQIQMPFQQQQQPQEFYSVEPAAPQPQQMAARPATQRAYARAKEINPNFGQPAIRTEEERKLLFGQTAAVVK